MSTSEEETQGVRESKDCRGRRKSSSSNQPDDERVRRLEELMENQRLEFEEQLRKKNEEIRKKEREMEETTPTVPPTLVVDIDQRNMEQVSLEHNGMLINQDGSLTRTPQYETYLKNRETQLKNTYETTPIMPEELNAIPNHPQPTNQNQKWSYKGDWHELPVDPNQEGTDQEDCKVVRVEPYIDTDGVIRRALSYGDDADRLGPWFNLEDIQKAFPKWKIPEPSKFFNNRKFSKSARRDLQENKKERKRGNYPPGDQSYKDIQGGRGGGRGRGSGRGGYQTQYRGRGRYTYNGGDRPSYGADNRRDREYREWDESQAARPSTSQSYEERMWHDYKEEMGYNQKGNDREPQRYYTREYEDKKRARSPSPRGERPSRGEGAYDRRDYSQDRRRDSNLESRGDPNYEASRRDYSPERRSRRDYSPGQGQDRRRERSRRDYSPDMGRRYPGQNR